MIQYANIFTQQTCNAVIKNTIKNRMKCICFYFFKLTFSIFIVDTILEYNILFIFEKNSGKPV